MTARDVGAFVKLVGLGAPRDLPDGSVEAELVLEQHHMNEGGIAHGGALVTLLDFAMGRAVVRTLGEGEWCATEALHTEFMRPATGRVVARGRVDRRGKLTCFVSGEVRDAEGKMVARATGVWAVRRG